MKKRSAIFLSLILPVLSFCQHTLTGSVLDQEGKSLPYATLYFTDLQRGTVSDDHGKYIFRDLPGGILLLEVRYIGFRTWVGKIDLDTTTAKVIRMIPAAAEMSEVVITGTASSVERRLNAVPTLILNSEELRSISSTNAIDLLSRQPGISQVTTGSGISKPVIRGLGYNRVIVLNDGIKQEDQQWGDEHGIEIDQYSIYRIEVVKGPGSLMYGSDALAGVINFLNPGPPLNNQLITTLISEYQTNNHFVALSVNNRGNLNGFNWLVQASGKLVGNFTNPVDGRVFNSGYSERNTNGYIGLNRKWGFTQLQYSLFSQNLGLVEGERDSLGRFLKPMVIDGSEAGLVPASQSDLAGYRIVNPSQSLLHGKLVSSSTLLIRKSRMSIKLGFQHNSRSEFADPVYPEKVTMALRLNTQTYDLKVFLPEKKTWESSLGFSGLLQENTAGGEEFLIPEFRMADFGIFVFSRKSIGKWNVSGGYRWDIRKLNSEGLWLFGEGMKFTSLHRTFSNFSGSIGSSYSVNDKLVFKLNIAKGFRAPNIAELASNGRHEGTFRYEVGNPGLSAESSLQANAGVDVDREHFSFEVEAFYGRINHYIFPEKLLSVFGGDSIVDPAEPLPTFGFVQGNSVLYGSEMTMDIHPHPYDWIHFENTFSFVRGILKQSLSGDQNLPMIPPARLVSQLKIEFPRSVRKMAHMYLMIGMEAHFRQDHAYTAYSMESPTPGYTLVNAGLGFTRLKKSKESLFIFQLNGSNLLDAEYQDHLSRLKYAPVNPANGISGIFNPGRNLGLKLIFPFTTQLKSRKVINQP